MRLRRTDLTKPGWTRRRRGRGTSYLDEQGRPLSDPAVVTRLRELAIPPAWRDVWINPDARGHIQAVGVDAAGRRQYLYHPVWRVQRDEEKFDHALDVAERLPAVRQRLCQDMTGRGLTRLRVLATVVRLLDLGMFRVGNEQYAAGDEPSYGLSTLRPEHVRGRGERISLEFVGKGGVEHSRDVEDHEVRTVLKELRRRRRGEERLFAYWDASARSWHVVRSADINDYLREISGTEMTAKDFRTWHGTVVAARELARAERPSSAAARKKVVSAAVREVADLLGNTPAVARSAYVDPRVVELYEQGTVAQIDDDEPQNEAERAVVDLLRENA